jgi:ankyrin repeat protein
MPATPGYDGDFFDAVEFGDLDGAKMYSCNGEAVDINCRERHDQTVLMIASYYGHSHIVAWLLSLGADTALRDSSGKTALDLARENGHAESTSLLTAAGHAP